MRISVPRGTHVGAVQAQQSSQGPPRTLSEEPPLASDEEWVTDSESESESTPRATVITVERNGMGGMMRMQNSGIHADHY